VRVCQACGHENRAEARFCDSCGASLAAEGALAREERKVVTVVFADLVGFTSRAERMDPEDVRALLAPYHARLRSELERFGGTVEKFIGDAVMALFGAPAAHEDDPERAVRAALAIRDWVRDQEEELQLRLAVNTGEALVTLGARPEAGEGMASGDVVNTAARLQSAAPVNGVLVGETTYRATRDVIDYVEREPVEAKGKAQALAVWEAVQARSRLGVDLALRTAAPLVGRRRELDLLLSAVARVREECSPQLVTLVGVPGIGKSRLVFELSQALEEERELITWRHGRCLPYGDGISFWALGEMVKTQAGILESDSPDQAKRKLHRAVVEVVPDEHEASWVEQQLRPLFGAGGEIGPRERSGEAFAAWRRFLEGVADLRPLVLVLEDLHWADEGLLEFVDELAERIREVPLLVLCTARPELLERQPGWGGGKANALTISLPPLSDDETAELVAAALEQPLLAADVQKALLARADGNPLYAEQFARVFAELGSLDELPETVQGIIAARLDSLPPGEKALLQAAAVVGKVFWVGALEAVGDSSRREAEELLFALERKQFVQRARRAAVAGEAEYAFRHVLLRDVAYAQIPRASRGEKHRRAAAWIESLGRPDDHAEMLAYHYLSALEYTKAAGIEDSRLVERSRFALRAAGDRALSLASYAAAARFYATALELWPENDRERVWLFIHTGRASHAADGTGLDLIERGFEELRSRGDADGAAEVAVDAARRFWLGGDRDAAYAYIDRGLELSEGGDSRARAYALVERAAYHMNASEHSQAIRLAREALPLVEALGIDDLHVRALDVLGSSRVQNGDVGGLDDSRRAIALARERNVFSRLIVAEFNVYFQQLFLGELAAASEVLRVFARDVERYGTADQRKSLHGAEAHEAVRRGRWDEATRLLDEVIAEAEAGAAPHYEDPLWRALRASIALASGQLEAASAGSEKALDRARRRKDPQILAPTLTVRGVVLLAQGRREEASRLASELLARGSVLVTALLDFHLTATPIEFAWLLRDLGREAELLSALESAPATPWLEAARAIANGDFTHAIELVVRTGAPSVEAYTRLRTAQELARAGGHAEADEQLRTALAFYRSVGATRYIREGEALLAASA
jgi:class 3 adenylate cyclase/tetratricopeptide (TPR) repeat protein